MPANTPNPHLVFVDGVLLYCIDTIPPVSWHTASPPRGPITTTMTHTNPLTVEKFNEWVGKYPYSLPMQAPSSLLRWI